MRVFGAIPLFLAAGCSSIDNFDVPIKGQAKIPGSSALEMVLGSFPTTEGFTRIDLTQSQTFKNEKYTVEDVDSVILTRLTMKTVNPASQDLAFLGKVIFFAEVNGLPKKEIARRESFPAGVTTVEFTVTPDDLKDYLLAKEATITTEAQNSRRPPQETTLEIEAIFDVDVAVL
jgi:hypothetical protein